MNTLQASFSQSGDRIETCGNCGQLLPLRLAGPREREKPWLCSRCHTRYDAVLGRDSPLELIQHVRPMGIKFCKADYQRVPQAIAEFIRKCLAVEEDYWGPERRSSERHGVAIPAVMMPIDAGFDPIGEATMVMARNISNRGASLVGTRAVNARFLAVELCTACGEQMQLVMRVLRCRFIRRFYEIGGQFVTKAGEQLATEPAAQRI